MGVGVLAAVVALVGHPAAGPPFDLQFVGLERQQIAIPNDVLAILQRNPVAN